MTTPAFRFGQRVKRATLAGNAAAPVMNTASKLTSGSNSLGIGGKVLYNAALPAAKLNK